MPATPLNPAHVMTEFGNKRYVFVAVIADPAAPTRTEINSGHDFTAQVQAVNGFTKSQAYLDAANAGGGTTPRVPGRSSYPDSGFTTYQDEDATLDVRSIWHDGDEGFVLIFDKGDVAGGTFDNFPVSIGTVTKTQAVDAIAMITTSMAIRQVHHADLVVPAEA